MRNPFLAATVFLFLGALATSASAQGWFEVGECEEEFDYADDMDYEEYEVPAYNPWTDQHYGYSYEPYANYGQVYEPYAGYTYPQEESTWTPYSAWSSGEVYGDGSSTLYQNYGGGDSTSMYYGNDGDMIINAGGEMWWPGK